MKDSHDKRREAEVYEDKKRLAEMAWAAVIASPGWVENPESYAWTKAEAMYDESERRRPQE